MIYTCIDLNKILQKCFNKYTFLKITIIARDEQIKWIIWAKITWVGDYIISIPTFNEYITTNIGQSSENIYFYNFLSMA